MHILKSIDEYNQYRRTIREKTVGFIPTMGNLHAGHLALCNASIRDGRITVASIFINPKQFDDADDFSRYPQTIEDDCKKLKEAGVDAVFIPKKHDIYRENDHFIISEHKLSRLFCGAHRPGHFDGVLTVVMKLFHIIRPDVAYFGEKDYQQLTLIRQMVDHFFMPIHIMGCPIVRDHDGLALSSRNQHLSHSERQMAAQFPAILKQAGSDHEITTKLQDAGFDVDYVTNYDGRRLGAVRLGVVRLIDNFSVSHA